MKKIYYKNNNYILGILFASIFFVIGLLTISHYGLNIDEPIHFSRGHAYMHLLLTGKDAYSQNDLHGQRISTWKIQQYNGRYFLNRDSGHPPLNGILAAAFNSIFYEQLGIVGDLESYHLFEIFVSSLLVFLVFIIARREFGLFAGIISMLSLALYPLFLGESHFNIKDPIEAAFFAYTIYFFYLGLEKMQGKYFFFSGIFCALAFGTKFNIVFLPFILIPYLIMRYFPVLSYLKYKKLKKIPFTVYFALITYPVIVLGIHFLTRPYLWANPIVNFLEIVKYYQEIGTGIVYQSDFIFGGWNIYPLIFIGFATPFIILLFSNFGIAWVFFHFLQERKKFSTLLFLWFAVPIIRVMWPGSSIYGGVRQIMEYVPAMAILSGVGATYFVKLLNNYISGELKQLNNKAIKQLLIGKTLLLLQTVVILSFLPITLKLISIHPNENLFMNSLTGGLKGAMEKRIPGAGESMGNAYLQGIWWLNEHAEKNASFRPAVGLGSNIPTQFVRSDIQLGNVFSGMRRDGEYMMEMVAVDYPPPKFSFRYLDTFLKPVHIVKVDGAVILKVWKNDLAHTKKEYQEEKKEAIEKIFKANTGYLEIYLENPAFITRLEILHANTNCIAEVSGNIYTAYNDGDMIPTVDELYNSQGIYAKSLQGPNTFVYFFPATFANRIKVAPADPSACLLQYNEIVIIGLKNLLTDD